MKATIRTSREGLAKHNDRTFNYSMEEHIDPTRVKDNVYMSYKNLPFTEAEKTYYTDHYSKWLETQNKRYREGRKPECCKTIASLLNGKHTQPEEMILQIGNAAEHPDADTFETCVKDYLAAVQEYSSNYHILDVAIHKDEATPHAHIRAVWDYTDKDGNLHIGQTGALKELGIEAPDPDLPGDRRFNNPKMTLTKNLREEWYGICEAHGIRIDKEPDRSNIEHKRIRDYILEQQKTEIRENEKTLAAHTAELSRQQEALSAIEEEIRRAEKELEEKAGKDRARRLLQSQELAGMLGELAKELMPETEQHAHGR